MPSDDRAKELWRRAHHDLEETTDEAHHYLQGHRRLYTAARVAVGVLREQSAERVSLAASGAALWLVISVFPTAIAVVSVYGLFVRPERVAADLGDLANDVPGSLGSLLSDQMRRVAETGHANLSFGLALSLVVALWSASAGFNNLDGAVRVAYGLPPQRYLRPEEGLSSEPSPLCSCSALSPL